ncbi:Succinate dehydrogenase assembly factor 2, mitochondrial [Frankliniella fusca]|uniref:Succinate dehydrogenase assembly factor 2, mitochondrial n=1 Tax=Frankliniella fusca TaxID=407009 RepID=A0AAE1H4F4_9NEOP|nr:Succinate dehydrogenase assembly factor 2, mitochondrial [Frankliniella fusca]
MAMKMSAVMKILHQSSSLFQGSAPLIGLCSARFLSQGANMPPETGEPPIPVYKEKRNEPLQLKRSRLVYQSRKRGMLENGLLLSTFAAKYLSTMSESHLQQYDRLINLPSNDWDIFYWATGVKPTPPEFETEVMGMLKEHVKNKDREVRLTQPPLN